MTSIHSFTRAGVEMSIDIKKLSPEIIDQLVRHGLTQKIGDAAANAKAVALETGVSVADAAKAMMEKVRDALLAGDWGTVRTGGGGVSEEVAIQRAVMREVMKASFGAKSPKWAEFTGKTDAEQATILDNLFAKNAAALAPKVAAETKRRETVRRAKAEAAKITVAIEL